MSRNAIKFFLLIFLLLFVHFSFSQNKISGVVINGMDNSKLPAASVFINNSTKGTFTNNNGEFTITEITETNFELVISYAGFETVSLKITRANVGSIQTIKLSPRKVELEEVKIASPEKDGWERWGILFTQNFIGTSAFSSECKIENPEVLRFFYDRNNDVIKVYSHGSMIINNKALGYKIKYQLEHFVYDNQNKIVSYLGYAVFEDLNKNNRRRKCETNRRQVYRGSFMHFIRTLITNTTAEEGFEVIEKIRLYNMDTGFAEIYRNGNIAPMVIVDTNKYYTQKSSPISGEIPAYIDLYNSKRFPLKKALGMDPVTKEKTFYFINYLKVTYNGKLSSPALTNVFSFMANSQVSEIFLIKDEPLTILANGSYFDPLNVLNTGYWGTCKMAATLPIDYNDK